MSKLQGLHSQLVISLFAMVFIVVIGTQAQATESIPLTCGFIPVQASSQSQLIHTLEALGQARQVLIANLSNSQTTTYKRLLVRFTPNHSMDTEDVHELIWAALGLQEGDTLVVKEAVLR